MRKPIRFRANVYTALLYRLLVVLFIFQLSRLGFFLFNRDSFPDTTFASYLKIMAGGFVFDLSAALYTNVLYIFLQLLPFRFRIREGYQKASELIFALTNSLALLANTIDYIYFRYTLRRTTMLVFNEFSNETNLGALVGQFIADFWYLALVLVPLIALMCWLYRRAEIRPSRIGNSAAYYTFSTLMLALGAFLFVGGVRGGFSHSTRPITISNATRYVTHLGEEFAVLNTPFSIYRTLGEERLPEYGYYEPEELAAVYSPVHLPDSTAVPQRKNVVLMILESFGREYIGALNREEDIPGYKGYTPFLDSLIGESMYFTHAFSNGRKSIEAMSSVMASIPSFQKPFVLSAYSHNNYESLNSLLGKEGYTTLFYHGAPNGSMGFDAFAKKLGTQHYRGKTEYGNDADFDGIWGIWDEPFLQFMARDLTAFPEPFVATVFTASSHHPYKVPEQYEGVFDRGHTPIHQVIGYSDHALKEFFRTASRQPWYGNTLFVLTADHTNLEYYDRYKTPYGRHYVPVVLFTPDGSLRGKRDETMQQIDILPTVLEYLGYDKPYFAFGTSLLRPAEKDAYAVTFYNNAYNFYQGDYLLVFDGEKTLALYDYRRDAFLQNDLKESETAVRAQMEDYAKAFVQTYNHALVHDEMKL